MSISQTDLGSLKQLSADLSSPQKKLYVNSSGCHFVTKRSGIIGVFDDIKHLIQYGTTQKTSLEKLPAVFNAQIFGSFEKQPILFYDRTKKLSVQQLDATKLQREYITALIAASTAVKERIKQAKGCKADSLLQPIEMSEVSLKYRLGAQNGGYDPQPLKATLIDDELTTLAASWKATQKNYPESDRLLTSRDEAHLRATSRYPHFVDQLKKNSALRTQYFKWIIRDHGSEQPFIEFYTFWNSHLHETYLAPRIACTGSQLLEVKTRYSKSAGVAKKVLTLPVEVQNQKGQLEVKNKNILNGSKVVTLNKNWQISFDKIFKIFQDKRFIEVGNIEYFGRGGIKNWHCSQLGYWNPATQTHDLIDLDHPNWWELLPLMESIEPLTRTELIKKYQGIKNLEKGEWVFIVKSTRTNPDLSIVGCHGFFEIAIPQADDTYKIYDFGKLTTIYPNGPLEFLSFLGDTVEGKIYYPDENIFYTFRQHAAWACKLTDQMGREKLMELIKKLLQISREGYMSFQFVWLSCAQLPQMIADTILKEKFQSSSSGVPDFFSISLFDLQVPQPFRALFALIRLLPAMIRPYMLKIVIFMAGGFRSRRVKEDGKEKVISVLNSPLSEKMCNYLPAYMLDKIAKGTLQGDLWHGVR